MPRTSPLRDDCHEQCSRYSYWWTYKASLMSRERFILDHCVHKCMHDTFKEKRKQKKLKVKD